MNHTLHQFLCNLETHESMRVGTSEQQDEVAELNRVSAYDIMRIVGVKGALANRLAKYEASVKDCGLEHLPVGSRWCRGATSDRTKQDHRIVPMLSVDNARRLVCFLLRRNMWAQSDIDRILKQFGIETKLFESAFVVQAEKDTLQSIARAIPYPSEEQFRVGKYRIDLYFPTLRLAIECNEYRHVSYDLRDDLTRRRFLLDQLHCRIVSYDPFASQFNVLDVIREIVELLVSREFQEWNKGQVVGPWHVNRDVEPNDDDAGRPEAVYQSWSLPPPEPTTNSNAGPAGEAAYRSLVTAPVTSHVWEQNKM